MSIVAMLCNKFIHDKLQYIVNQSLLFIPERRISGYGETFAYEISVIYLFLVQTLIVSTN